MKDGEARCAAVHGVVELDMTEQWNKSQYVGDDLLIQMEKYELTTLKGIAVVFIVALFE